MHSNQNNWLKDTKTKDSWISRSTSISNQDSQWVHTILCLCICTEYWSLQKHYLISLLIAIKTILIHVMHAISQSLATLSFWHKHINFTALEEEHNEQELKIVKWNMSWFYENYQKTTSQIKPWNNYVSSVIKNRVQSSTYSTTFTLSLLQWQMSLRCCIQ